MLLKKYLSLSGNPFGIAFILFLITIITRLPFTSKILFSGDSVQFALGIQRYDITVHQPHPPGYFLYVMLGKLLNLFTHDANTSFVTLSVLASGLTVVAIYKLANQMHDRKTALWSSILVISSPLFWFYGEVAQTYMIEAFFSAFFAYLCWRILNGEHRLIFVSALLLAVAGGFRQSTLIFLIPLWLYSIRKAPYKYILVSFSLLVIGVMSWFLPMLSMTGGYRQYIAAVDELWAFTFEPVMFINAGLGKIYSNSNIIMWSVIYGIGLCTAFIVFYLLKTGLKEIKRVLLSKKGIFIAFWIFPAILFYQFIYIGRPGYCLIFMPALIIASGNTIKLFIEKKYFSLKIFIPLICITIFLNLYFFFEISSPVSLNLLKRQYSDIMNFSAVTRKNFNPSDTIILSYDYTFNGPRNFMYYLPEYKVYIINERVDKQGRKRKVFWGYNRNTFVSQALYVPNGTKFFISPFSNQNILNDMMKSGEKINVLKKDGEEIAFYGDIRLAPKAYRGVTFDIKAEDNK